MDWKTIQQHLDIKADGIPGRQTAQAVAYALGLSDWKAIQKHLQIQSDGIPGPKTMDAIAKKLYIEEVKAIDNATSGRWPTQKQVWSNQSIFGKAGDSRQDMFYCPYPMKLAWAPYTTIYQFSCNAGIKEALNRIFTKTLSHYGEAHIKNMGLDLFGGCYNFRTIRNKPGGVLSMHAYGIAVDIDPDNNRYAWGKDKARLAKPEYEKFWQFVEEEGGVSLGRRTNKDWMHFQFAEL